ncbi:MAG: hypothetical protein QM762_18065 [Chryseolinea sp.]
MIREVISLSAILVLGCAKEKQSIQSRPDSTSTVESIEVEPEPTAFPNFNLEDRVDIDAALKIQDNAYMATLDSGTLSLCCYDLLDITQKLPSKSFERTAEEYKDYDGVKIVDVWSKGGSFYKLFNNSHPDVRRTELVCGQIRDEEVVFSRGIRVGMPKRLLLTQMFLESQTLARVDELKIVEDEMGEAWTIYVFRNDTLREIRFDSYNDWIERMVKK